MKDSDMLKIAVTFRRPQDGLGVTKYAARLNAGVISNFVPDLLSLNQGLLELDKLGFNVTTQGKFSVSIRGSRQLFEKVFKTKLSLITQKHLPLKFYYPAEGAPWNPPAKLMKLIDDAYIQWPHIYLNKNFSDEKPSPLAPQVDYFHLRVPGDVALLLNAAKVHREGITGKGIRVAMIDSGFTHQHQYFLKMGYKSSVVLAPGATDVNMDGVGHGTGESANIFAVAPDVNFVGVKLDNESSPNLGASLLEGFQVALSHNPQVISVSLCYDLRDLNSLPNSLKALEAEVAAAVAGGIVVVFSAGNGHVAFPGMMPDVISAGGVYVDSDGTMMASDYASAFKSKIYLGRNVPDFCGLVGLAKNHADYIMLPLPSGCEIDEENAKHDKTKKEDGWGVFSGTSASAPQLAGLCALLLQKNPGLTPSDIKAILKRTCRDVILGNANPNSNNGVGLPASSGIDGATGAGLVDAFAAFQQA